MFSGYLQPRARHGPVQRDSIGLCLLRSWDSVDLIEIAVGESMRNLLRNKDPLESDYYPVCKFLTLIRYNNKFECFLQMVFVQPCTRRLIHQLLLHPARDMTIYFTPHERYDRPLLAYSCVGGQCFPSGLLLQTLHQKSAHV